MNKLVFSSAIGKLKKLKMWSSIRSCHFHSGQVICLHQESIGAEGSYILIIDLSIIYSSNKNVRDLFLFLLHYRKIFPSFHTYIFRLELFVKSVV